MDAFRAFEMERDRPHTSYDTAFVVRYIPEKILANIMRRLSVILMPEVSKRVGQHAIVISHAH